MFLATQEDLVRQGRGMSTQCGCWIPEQAVTHRMIEHFSEEQVREGGLSCSHSFNGNDVGVSAETKFFTNANSGIVDRIDFDEQLFVSIQAEPLVPPIGSPWRGTLNTFESPGKYLRSALENRPVRVAE